MEPPPIYESSSSEEEPIDRDDMDTMFFHNLLQRKHAQRDAKRDVDRDGRLIAIAHTIHEKEREEHGGFHEATPRQEWGDVAIRARVY